MIWLLELRETRPIDQTQSALVPLQTLLLMGVGTASTPTPIGNPRVTLSFVQS